MRAKVLATLDGPDLPVHRGEVRQLSRSMSSAMDRSATAGSPIAWSADEVAAGWIEATTPDGEPVAIRWDEVASDPGGASSIGWWPTRCGMRLPMPATCWTSPGKRPTARSRRSMATSTPTSRRSTWRPSRSRSSPNWPSTSPTDALAEYVEQLEGEVRKYVAKDPRNYGKAAKRMYNIFRLNGRYAGSGLRAGTVRRACCAAVPGARPDPDHRRGGRSRVRASPSTRCSLSWIAS